MTSSAITLLPRLLLATGWTCTPSETDPKREVWRRGSEWQLAWTTAACGTDTAALGARLQDLLWVAETATSSTRLQLGERLGLLRAADAALDEAAAYRAAGEDRRADASERMARLTIMAAGVDPAAWIATREVSDG